MELDKTESDVLSKNIEVSAHTVKKKKKVTRYTTSSVGLQELTLG